MSLLETKFYLILCNENGQYRDAASFPALSGVAAKIREWRKDAKILERKGDYVLRMKVTNLIALDAEEAPKKGKK